MTSDDYSSQLFPIWQDGAIFLWHVLSFSLSCVFLSHSLSLRLMMPTVWKFTTTNEWDYHSEKEKRKRQCQREREIKKKCFLVWVFAIARKQQSQYEPPARKFARLLRSRRTADLETWPDRSQLPLHLHMQVVFFPLKSSGVWEEWGPSLARCWASWAYESQIKSSFAPSLQCRSSGLLEVTSGVRKH